MDADAAEVLIVGGLNMDLIALAPHSYRLRGGCLMRFHHPVRRGQQSGGVQQAHMLVVVDVLRERWLWRDAASGGIDWEQSALTASTLN